MYHTQYTIAFVTNVFASETLYTLLISNPLINHQYQKIHRSEDPMYTHFVQGEGDQLDPTWFCLQTKSSTNWFVVTTTSPPTTINYIVCEFVYITMDM